MGTVFIASGGGRTYSASRSSLRERNTGFRFSPSTSEGSPQWGTFSSDRQRLLLFTSYRALMLRASDLHLLRRMDSPLAWWEGARIGCLDDERHRLLTGGRWHRLDPTWSNVLLSNPDGRYFLGDRSVGKEMSRHVLTLWAKTPPSHLRFVRKLTEASYDPASWGSPRQLAVLDDHTALFGLPAGSGSAFDTICLLRDGHVSAPLKDAVSHELRFSQIPVRGRGEIVGLAEAWRAQPALRYLYYVRPSRVSLKRVSSNTVLVTYDPIRGVGLGVAEKGGVTVRYGKPP